MDSITKMYNDTKAFVKEHQTVIACGTTAVVSTATAIVLTRKIDTRIATAFLYAAGQENGVLAMQNAVLRDFIDAKGLKDELLYEFIPALGEHLAKEKV